MGTYRSNEDCILDAERYAESNGISLGNASPILRHSSDFYALRATRYNKTDDAEAYKANLIKNRVARVERQEQREEATVANVIAGLPEELRLALLGEI